MRVDLVKPKSELENSIQEIPKEKEKKGPKEKGDSLNLFKRKSRLIHFAKNGVYTTNTIRV
jgi:hypothetical protein